MKDRVLRSYTLCVNPELHQTGWFYFFNQNQTNKYEKAKLNLAQ